MIFVQFWLFLSKFQCHSNSLGSLEILDSISEFADTENLIMHAKIADILYRNKIMLICMFSGSFPLRV